MPLHGEIRALITLYRIHTMLVRLLAIGFVGIALIGCSSSLPPETDATKGLEAMKTTLETWKKGGTIDELLNGSPSIQARDPDWKAGLKLTKYEIGDETDRAGVDLLLSVKLSLVRTDGQTVEKKVRFTVGIGSSIVVLRSE